MKQYVLVFWLGAAALAAIRTAAAAPSVLVTTIPVKSGAIARNVTVYGRVGPGPGASETLSIGYAGMLQTLAVMPGSAVRRGEALAVVAIAPSAQATYAESQAKVRAAQQNLAHTRTLVANHLATVIQLAQAEQAQETAIVARNALRREGASRTATTITAPYNGIIAHVAAMPGATVMPGSPLITIMRATGLVVTAGLDAREASEVKPGDRVILKRFTAPGPHVTGTVRTISAMINLQTGLVDATIALDHGGLLVGEPVTAIIDLGTARGVIVPRDAALPHQGRFQIWQIAHGHAKPVRVRIIAHTPTHAVVTGPIDPALPIVVSGNYQLKPGMKVRIKR